MGRHWTRGDHHGADEVQALPGGGSRVRLAVEQGGWLGSLMGRFYRGLTDRYLTIEAAGLKARCEGER